MRIRLVFYCVLFGLGLSLFNKNASAQIPNISYSPSTDVLVLNTAMTSLTPSNSGGAVATFAYGPGTQLTGATLSNPDGMAVDPSGNIYVSNYGNNTISKYNSSGAYVGTFGTGGAISNPIGIVFDASGNAYILSYNRTNNGNGNHHGNAYIEQYSSTGAYVSTIVQGLGTATGISIDASGNLDVAEGSYNNGNAAIAEYTTAGALAFSLTNTNIPNPVGVGADGSGNIYVLDNTDNDVVKFNSTGTYVSTPVSGLTAGGAYGIYIDGAGDIYIGDSDAHTVTVYNTAGTVLTSISGSAITDPEGMVTDSKGNLYISDYTNNTVFKYPPVGGYYLSARLPAGLSFNTTTGVFSGTPTAAFSATTYTVTAYNANGSSSTTETLSCPAIVGAPIITYAPYSVDVFTLNTNINWQLNPPSTTTPLAPVNSGGTPYSTNGYSISPTTLPTGLSFSKTTGTISGIPTVATAAADYTITATNASGSGTAIISIACVVDDYWTGKKSADWNTKQNWSTGSVPTSGELASIGVVNYTGSDPIILATDGAISMDYVTFGAANAATLTVLSGASLTVNKILTINNNAAPIVTGTGTGAINVGPAAVINVTGTGALTISSPLTFTLQSTAAGSATVNEITTGSITGTVSVQRYFQGGSSYVSGRYTERGYRVISSPVNIGSLVNGNSVFGLNYIVGATKNETTTANSTTNSFITGCTGGSTAVGNPSIYLYREDLAPSNASFTSGNYIGISNITNSTTAGTITGSDGKTYSIPVGNSVFFFFRGNATNWTSKTTAPYVAPENTTLTATGTLNQGSITVNDWFTPTAGLSNTGTGFSFAGNPYAATIDWETSPTGLSPGGIVTSNLDPSIYEFDPVSEQFEAYSTSLHLGTGNASRYIASGQGFVVQAGSAGSGSIQFTESAKAATQQNTGTGLLMAARVRAANDFSSQQILRLKLIAADTLNHSDILVGFKSTASANYSGMEDSRYITGSGAPAGLWSFSDDNIKLAINVLPLPKQTQQEIRLNVAVSATGTYTLQRTALQAIPQIYDVWLMDKYLKDSLDIRNNSTYTFTSDLADTNSFGGNRFSLIIRQNPALAVHLLSFTALKATGGAEVSWTTENEQNYTNFSVERSSDGGVTFNDLTALASNALGAYSFLDTAPPLAADMYRLKIVDLNGTVTYSSVVTLMYANKSNTLAINNLTVYPNPATTTVNLAIAHDNDKALYNIEIVNNIGTIVKAAKSSEPSWKGNVSQLLPGTYFIRVVNSNNNSIVGSSSFVKL